MTTSGTAVSLAMVSGAGVSAQLTIQAQLTTRIGAIEAALCAAVSGFTITALALLAVRRGFGGLRHIGSVPWWMLVAGLIGAAYVLSMAVASGRIGVVSAISLFFASQMTAAAVIDQFGLLRSPIIQLTPSRAVGILLVLAGALLTLRA